MSEKSLASQVSASSLHASVPVECVSECDCECGAGRQSGERIIISSSLFVTSHHLE
jgi:hypothetical protein